LYGINQDPTYLYMLLEYIGGGELFTYMKTEGKLESATAR
jgi:serine/threonine protein kinase